MTTTNSTSPTTPTMPTTPTTPAPARATPATPARSAVPAPFDVPAASHSYLARSAASLREAITTSEVPLRYAHAHVAALRATAALLAARATPTPRRSGRGRPVQRNAWVLLAQVAPEFAEWATFFSAGAAKRAAAESGSTRAVTEREADDLVRDADRFLALVEESLGLDRHTPIEPTLLPWQPDRSSGGPSDRTADTGRPVHHVA
jgi:hypothetical protein